MATVKTIMISEDCYRPEKNLILRLTPAQYNLLQLLREREVIDENNFTVIELDKTPVYEFTETTDPTATDEEKLMKFIRSRFDI